MSPKTFSVSVEVVIIVIIMIIIWVVLVIWDLWEVDLICSILLVIPKIITICQVMEIIITTMTVLSKENMRKEEDKLSKFNVNTKKKCVRNMTKLLLNKRPNKLKVNGKAFRKDILKIREYFFCKQ